MSRRAVLALPLALAACSDRPAFDAEDIRHATLGAGLPSGFLLGTATASHQIEGGTVNDWSAWEQSAFPDGRPHIKDGSVSGDAAQSWQRFDTDVALMKTLGANAYRFSLEWSRLQPARGQWDEAALARYREQARALRQQGITPLVTLYHFTLPQWVSDAGGWENPATLDDFEAYAAHVAEVLGDEVDWWCTVNEPNVLAVFGYLDGVWPPGKKDAKAMATALSHLIEAHARASRQLRVRDTVDADGDGYATRVGLAHHVRIFQPATGSTADITAAGLTDSFFNESVPLALRTGRIHLSVPGSVSIDREVADLKGSSDWLGLNYYSRDYVRQDFREASLSNQYVPSGRPVSDLGWDIYPEGLYLFLLRFRDLGIPLFVTENGMADAEGNRRPDYFRSHVYAVEQAVKEGADVRGYFHWSLMDNFEWAEGYTPRFGLFRVDFDSPDKARAPTPAVESFQDVARNLGLMPTP
ncbi:glycoside hydrolase family 1 protein [Pyxidicoccus parkwayensis]|uniref:Glycoside hydrolase family 1 protein n=1 Tax=Pyxidicoccus parkwayensis TaxID=2813578 RepID=A0ABX7NUP3_9BACT|nr:glycoside hydrolase family 1 protein [Pyxidicoccus parkwaysis]QSQ22198.1 glycoside hydrolase family 1 protein [Pyxidicoccus parkwaysis]